MMALPLLTWRSKASRCAKFWLRLEPLGVGKTNSEASLRSGDDGTLLVGVPLMMYPPGTERNDVKARATFDLGCGGGASVKSWGSVVARMMRMIKTKHTNTAPRPMPKPNAQNSWLTRTGVVSGVASMAASGGDPSWDIGKNERPITFWRNQSLALNQNDRQQQNKQPGSVQGSLL